MKPLYRKTLLRFLPIVCDLERTNQLNLLPDKDLETIHLYQIFLISKLKRILNKKELVCGNSYVLNWHQIMKFSTKMKVNCLEILRK